MSRVHSLILALLSTTSLVIAEPTAPTAPPEPTAPPSLADELADLDPRWSFRATPDFGTFTHGEQTVTVAVIAGCEGYGSTPRVAGLEVFRETSAAPNRLCLQRRGRAVRVELGTIRELSMLEGDMLDLVRAIGDRLRPAVAIPALGISLRSHLLLEPTDDGFVAWSSRSTRFVVSSRRGTCGMVERDPEAFTPNGPPNLEMPRLRGTRSQLELCRERVDDALVITIIDPVFAPQRYSADRPTLDGELALLIHTLVHELPREPRPRTFGAGAVLALNNAGVELRASHSTGGGWGTADPVPAFKLVDGAAWEEPNADVLLPLASSAYAVVVRRESCVGQVGSSMFVPREVAVSDHTGTRYQARACIEGILTASVLPLGTPGATTDPEAARAVIAALARSRGMRIEGRQARVDYHGALSVPLYTEGSGTHGGVSMRGGGSLIMGRPFGLVLLGGFAIGVAGDNYHPGDEQHMDPNAAHADLLGEIYGGAGAALTLGPVTAGVGATLHGDAYWPGTRDIYRAIGLAAVQLGDDTRAELRTSFGIEHHTMTHEAIFKVGPFMAMARMTDLVDAPGARGFEIGVGIDSRRERPR